MSYVIMCKNRIAKHPYVISDLRIKLYTLEEACYYIYQNMLLCSEEILDEAFLIWFKEELGLEDLYEKLKVVFEKEAKASRIAYFILEYADFFRRSEIDEICKCIQKSGEYSMWSRRKMRADLSFERGNFKDAIRDYEEMLTTKDEHPDAEVHDVIYNIGCCYGGMMYYDIAYMWFSHALEYTDSPEDDIKGILICKKMTLSDYEYKQYLLNHNQYSNIAEALEKDWEEAEQDFSKSDEIKKMSTIWEGKQGRNTEYYETIEQIVASWKD